jgi:two-component system chemotaxis response regulator CheB
MEIPTPYKAVTIGTSAGGIEALNYLLPHIPAVCRSAFFVVQHIHPSAGTFFIEALNEKCHIKLREACSTETIQPGLVYFAPPDYHMLIEKDLTISLSMDEKVNYSRPSIDVLFDSAAVVFKTNLTGILLTGANYDGSQGLKHIHEMGGYTIVQQPETAAFGEMPSFALKLFTPNEVLSLPQIAQFLKNLK